MKTGCICGECTGMVLDVVDVLVLECTGMVLDSTLNMFYL
jgi:hypothetical protein